MKWTGIPFDWPVTLKQNAEFERLANSIVNKGEKQRGTTQRARGFIGDPSLYTVCRPMENKYPYYLCQYPEENELSAMDSHLLTTSLQSGSIIFNVRLSDNTVSLVAS